MNSRKCDRKKFIWAAAALFGIYGILNALAKRGREAERSDTASRNRAYGKRRHRGECQKTEAFFYEKYIKRIIDKGLSFAGMVILAPLYGMIALAIVIDDPGPVLFTQKRIGKNKELFMLHKFRSMKMSTPHDVPTHQLENPEQYITRTGKFLRKYSLDELPQIWDIFRGKMSIIGPRPALWNQDDLVAERDKYGANDILPGLTGWAQINGRDELEIADKARLDGEYVKRLQQGGVKALFFDAKCFLGTIFSVLGSDGVVEGGTGELHRTGGKSKADAVNVATEGRSNTVSAEDAGFEDYGYRKHFDIDTSDSNKKRVLITGSGSYIGESFQKWAKEHYSANFTIDTVDMLDPDWRAKDFSSYDAVFHVAGIAHADVGRVSEEEKKKYYAVNTDLAVETAGKAKAEGIKQFILMSSMIIYGDSAPYGKEKVIDEHSLPAPANFYGDSKWQADKRVRALADEAFRVAVLRPPMIYGKGSKGNYPVLAKLAKKLPVFPDVENRRSMLYIDNLCEFLCKLMLSGEGGVYFPQNGEYTKTSEMVRQIAVSAGRRIRVTKMLKLAVMIGSRVPGKISKLVDKAFGNCIYSCKLSEYDGLDYKIVKLEESVKRTESTDARIDHEYVHSNSIKDKPIHILVVSQYFYPETFRINDMASEWIKRGYRVTVLTGIPNYPMGKFFDGYGYRSHRREQWNGMEIIRIPLIPRGKSSVGMIVNYLSFVISGWWWKMTTDIYADLVFTFEVSPMTQALIGVWYAKRHQIPHFLYVQDLWPENIETVTGIKNPVFSEPIDCMVDYIYKNTDEIFTTSPSFSETIINRKKAVSREKVHYWPQYAEYFYRPLEEKAVRKNKDINSSVHLIPDDGCFNIAFTGNIGKAQGLDILPKTAELLKDVNVRFIIVGDGRYQEQLEEEIVCRKIRDKFVMIPRQPAEMISSLLACCDAAFLSFMETDLFEKTIPAKLQSYMACGMPIIAAAKGETKRLIERAECGICVPIGDHRALADAIVHLMNNELVLADMRQNSRKYCEIWFEKSKLMDEMDKYIMCVINQAK